jgi:hypothetical protein
LLRELLRGGKRGLVIPRLSPNQLQIFHRA